jgi:uncharacterized membrane protein
VIFVQIGARFLLDAQGTPWVGLLIISSGCFGVGLTYTMFAPPVYIAAFLTIAFRLRKKVRLTKILAAEILVFAIPVLFTLAFTVLIGRGDAGSDLGAQFTIEGAIYRNLLGDFLIWLPLALFAVVFAIRKRKWDFPIFLTLIFAVFQAYFLARMVQGTVSTYYYYKLNFGTWFLVLFLAGSALSLLTDDGNRRAMAMTVCYLFVFFAAALFTVRGYDYTLSQRNENMNPISAANGLFGIYANNNAYFNYPENDPIYYTKDFLTLCEAARTERGRQPGAGSSGDFYTNRVEIVTDAFRDAYWTDALVREHIEQKPVTGIETLPDGNATIWIVLKNSDLYRQHDGEIDALKRVYENDMGFVALLSENGRDVA